MVCYMSLLEVCIYFPKVSFRNIMAFAAISFSQLLKLKRVVELTSSTSCWMLRK